jgi:hypothetical protein
LVDKPVADFGADALAAPALPMNERHSAGATPFLYSVMRRQWLDLGFNQCYDSLGQAHRLSRFVPFKVLGKDQPR